jgi:hypothetical protein
VQIICQYNDATTTCAKSKKQQQTHEHGLPPILSGQRLQTSLTGEQKSLNLSGPGTNSATTIETPKHKHTFLLGDCKKTKDQP